MQVTGIELFIDLLKSEGVDKLFAYPGGQVIPTFDGLYKQNDIDVILPRHEQALVHEADGYARATGKVGVALVTSGPGATNTVTGIATAWYDSVPLVVFTGQVATKLIGNDAFQEVDIVGITRSITKHSVVITDRKDMAKIIKEAFYIARTGKPGVVVVDLPQDIMKELGSNAIPQNVTMRGYKPYGNVHTGQLRRAVNVLLEAKKPIFLAGGGINVSRGNKEFTKLVEKTGIPVITTIMGRGAISTEHPLYFGNLGMHGNYTANNAIQQCDLLFSIGTRFNDRIAGNIAEFAPNAKIVHIDIDPASISRNIIVDIPIVADAKKAVVAMMDMVHKMDTAEWIDQLGQWKQEHPLKMKDDDKITPIEIMQELNKRYPEAIVTTDVGQHQMWASQYIEVTEKKLFITSGGLGTMGFGLPSAIGAQIGCPEKRVISISGDGGFQMNLQELATAVTQELPILVVIINNTYLGMVRQWQGLFYNKNYSSTCLRERKSCQRKCGECQCPPYVPDFVKLAESYGLKGFRATNTEEMKNVFDKAEEELQKAKQPVIVELFIEPELDVMPMVPSGESLDNMILEVEKC